MTDSLRALAVVASAEAEDRGRVHGEAVRAEERARAACDDARERCAMIDASLAESTRETGSSAAERAMSHARSSRWRERRAAARALLAGAERALEKAVGAVEQGRAALGSAHGDRRVAETALARSEEAVRVIRERRAEDDP